VVAKERAEVSWLSGVESVMSQCGKFEIDALVEGWWMNGCLEGERDPA